MRKPDNNHCRATSICYSQAAGVVDMGYLYWMELSRERSLTSYEWNQCEEHVNVALQSSLIPDLQAE